MRSRDLAWWQTGVIYQIYPRSFQDTNGDGIGDLAGITARLDHLVDLGVDAIWISPIYASPMADFGYDVSDYCGIDPAFGTLADFDALIAAAHARELRVILDYVPNHSSDQHPWFVESRSSRGSSKRDWFVWRDPKPDGSPPNNWLSEFGGPAWTFDEATGQYYYHAYLKEQPDLNWRNPEVQSAMLDALRFWLKRGVDGFRVDAIHHLFEDEQLRDNPPNPDWQAGMSPARSVIRAHTMDQPEVHDAIAAMRRVSDAYADRVLIGEAYLPIDRLMAYYGQDLSGFHLPFNFHLLSTPWNPTAIASLIEAYEAALPPGGWPNWVLGNHDRSRLVSRLGAEQARIAALLLLTLRGTPTIYQGEEIGMADVPIPPDCVQDPWEKNVPGLGLGRDPVRTPIPWSQERNWGFTEGEPWLPVESALPGLNVAAQSQDSTSLLSFYRTLLRLRRAEPALSAGDITIVEASDSVLAYERSDTDRRLLVALNFRSEAATVRVGNATRILASSYPDLAGTPLQAPSLELRRNEGIVIELA
ncbi:alpha-amylase family glycosyl hydrolase [Methylobacterium oxalidis]|uniref:Alpha-amylase n=1 Tax=Methylobacterium oxalidis TaxID=944322 RepID=A0A512J1L5_9HYPH|nr:alpha-amylase family glycosyl hydrolase [Methylobacterium oxalidis]GEP03835.1 alpha-amylase [Methylobacterium oxalidis]GJE31291.1 Oligo-1,6-glucosidase 1 [Methylobacterium oxalidis]GLS65307.1 alpha-amylase [Methylobacterium oxalidis]